METTIYGNSLRLNIPRLTCDQTNCGEQNIFLASRYSSTPASEAVIRDTHRYILSMINCFVDFFIQYQTINNQFDTTDVVGMRMIFDTTDVGMQKILELKKIIFSLCLLNAADLAADLQNNFQIFFEMFKEKYGKCIIQIKNNFEFVQDVGIPDLTTRETIEGDQTESDYKWFRQKSMNLFLLGLSYKVLFLSGPLGIQIKHINQIIRDEKTRESSGKRSFILQFLPYGIEEICFKEVDDFFLNKMNSIIFQKISELAGVDGGSKCLNIKYNKKSKKNKSRKFKYQKNTKKGRKHSRHKQRKRTQNKIL
jgi:hypothetical protein